MKNIKKILIVIAVLVLLMLAWYLFIENKINKGDLIKYEGKYYTKENFQKIIPPQVYEVESKNTPEEAYTTFRQALLDGEIEKALGEIREEKRDKFDVLFEDAEMLEKYKSLPSVDEIKKSESDLIGNYASYFYFEKNMNPETEIPYSVEFIKDINGYWKIDQI